LIADAVQFEKLSPFDGTMAYAQNKRQQVITTEQFAKVKKHNLLQKRKAVKCFPTILGWAFFWKGFFSLKLDGASEALLIQS
jgi:hypothetical protein